MDKKDLFNINPEAYVRGYDASVKRNMREHDLVRQMRGELLVAQLITDDEYAALASKKGSVERLEDYDVLRRQLIETNNALDAAIAEQNRLKNRLEEAEEKLFSLRTY